MKRIEKEAEEKYPAFPVELRSKAFIACEQKAFIAGALSEQARAHKLVEALKEIIGEAITKRECENIAKQALSDWEGEKEGV